MRGGHGGVADGGMGGGRRGHTLRTRVCVHMLTTTVVAAETVLLTTLVAVLAGTLFAASPAIMAATTLATAAAGGLPMAAVPRSASVTPASVF